MGKSPPFTRFRSTPNRQTVSSTRPLPPSPDTIHKEATRAAFRQCSLTHTLNPKFLALVTDLQLVDTKNSAIRCQGQCKNGGRCRQRINRAQVERSVLQLQTVALDGSLDEEELQQELELVFEELLCGSAGHCTEGQVERCAARARPVVEGWRERWVDTQSSVKEQEGGEEGECKRCAELEVELSDAVAQVEDRVAERDELRQQIAQLTIGRDDAVSDVEILRVKYQRLRESRDEAVDWAQDLAKQLQTLQIKHDGLMGRMATELEQHRQSSRNSTPTASVSEGNAVPLSKFAFRGVDGDEESAAPSLAGQASRSSKEQPAINLKGCGTPLINTVSPSPSISGKSSMSEVQTPEQGPRLYPKQSICANLSRAKDVKSPPPTMTASPFANLSVSGRRPGILGIGNTTTAGRPQHQTYSPEGQTGILTPDSTPGRGQRVKEQQRRRPGDLVVKAGPLQTPGGLSGQGKQMGTVESDVKPLRPRKGVYNVFSGMDSSAEAKQQGKGKEKAPFGFTVRKRES